jgi:hypothetical protein
MSRRGVLSFVALVALLILGAFLAGPRAAAPLGSSTGPEGTLALRRFLAGMGLEVAEGDVLASVTDTFVLLRDLRTPEEAGPIVDWVSRGGRLVLADPQSFIAAGLGILEDGPIGGFALQRTLVPSCTADEAAGVERVAVLASDMVLRARGGAAASCFPHDGGAFQVTVAVGDGEVVVLGGYTPLTNELLRREDNAAYAYRLAGGRQRVVFGEALPPGAAAGRSGGIWEALPTAARVSLVQVMIAGALFALARGRRLGRPVIEESPAPIAAGELVRATGRLYRSARAAGFAGDLLRRRASARLQRRLGVSPAAGAEPLVRAVAASRGEPEERTRAALAGPEPVNDEDLMAFANELDELVRRTEEARR